VPVLVRSSQQQQQQQQRQDIELWRSAEKNLLIRKGKEVKPKSKKKFRRPKKQSLNLKQDDFCWCGA
jgi:hypothetical protein